MDRRQKKSREAIMSAFGALLAEKRYGSITVQDIIDRADVGRSTFYAHFETRDELLRELCGELFGHIIHTAMGPPQGEPPCAWGDAADPVFLHLLRHLQRDERNILALLSSQNNDIFLQSFKENLKKLVRSQYAAGGLPGQGGLPEDYLVNHISASFVEAVGWWLDQGMRHSPEEIAGYFMATVEPLLPGEKHGNA